MSEFDIDAFITELERPGMKLTAIQLPDGTYRVNRWRMPDATTHTQEIEHLWATHLGDNRARMMLLAVRLAQRAPNCSGPDSTSTRLIAPSLAPRCVPAVSLYRTGAPACTSTSSIGAT
jgi:hypothetical protein